VGEPHLTGFRICYAAHPPETLARGLAIVADAIRALM